MVRTENLFFHGIRMPKGAENETGAEVVMEYKCEETGAEVNVHAQRSAAGKFQWMADSGKVDNEQALLLSNSAIVKTWAETSIKYVKEKYL